jgi:hypothetical protein
MAKTITHDDKFHRKFAIQTTGDVIDQGSKLESGIGNLLTVENHLRVSTEGLGAANSIEVRARMLDESSWTTIATVSGNETKLVDITTYEVIHFYVANYDASAGHLIVTGFVKNAPPGLGESVQICDSNNNCAELIDIGGNFALPVVNSIPTTSPTIYNINITAPQVNTVLSQAIINGATRILIKHRETAKVDFGFTAALPTFIEIPRGASYEADSLNLQSQTLYFRTDKTGIIEILVWS